MGRSSLSPAPLRTCERCGTNLSLFRLCEVCEFETRRKPRPHPQRDNTAESGWWHNAVRFTEEGRE